MLIRICAALILSQRFTRTHPKLVLIFVGILTAFFVAGIPRLQTLLSIDDMIDPDFKTYQGLKTVNEQFRDKNAILLSIESQEAFTKSFICDLQKWILEAAEKRPELIQIQSTFGIRQARFEGQRFFFNSFLDLNCLSIEPETEKIKYAFEKIKSSPWNGLLSTHEDYSLTINFTVYDLEDKSNGSLDTTIYHILRKNFEKRFPDLSYKAYWGGVITYQSYLKEAMDITQALNILMFVISLLVFKLFLGSWTSGILFNATITTSMIWSYGFMGFLGIPVDVLTNTGGLILSVSCLEDFAFIAYGMMRFKWSFRKSLRNFIIPSFFTSMATSLGFISLGAAELGIVRRIGFIGAFGGLLEWAMVFIALPALVQLWPRLKNLKIDKPVIKIRNPVTKTLNRWQTALAIGAILLPIPLWKGLKVKDSPEAFFAKTHYVNTTSDHLKETRGWLNEASLLFSQDNSDETNRAIVQQFKTLDNVFKVESSFDVKDYISADLDPSDKRVVEQLWTHSWFAKRLISNEGYERAQVYLKNMEAEDIRNLQLKSQEICQGRCELVGTLIAYNEFGDKVLNTLFKSLGLSLILITLVMFWIRKPLTLYEISACIISSLWGSFALLGIFVVFDIPVYFATSICAGVLVGLAGDNAVHFIFAAKRQALHKSIEDLEDGSIIVTLSMCLMVTVFCFSPIVPLAKLGALMLLGFFLGYLGDIWVLKGMLKK